MGETAMVEFMTSLEPRLLMAANTSAAHLLIAGGRGGDAIFATARPVDKEFDFSRGKRGWRAGFADYPAGEEANFELHSGLKKLPAGVTNAGRKGFFISGNNHSDDLFMFLKRKLGRGDGIKPGESYRVSFDIDFASEAPEGCAGIGGSPGNSVFLKAGADQHEPRTQ